MYYGVRVILNCLTNFDCLNRFKCLFLNIICSISDEVHSKRKLPSFVNIN